MAEEGKARFAIGQLVRHQLFDYRGAIYDVDADFQGSEEWYEEHARSRPPRNRPWYRVLVDGNPAETYVAERNLLADEEPEPISNPLVEAVFADFSNGRYVLRYRNN